MDECYIDYIFIDIVHIYRSQKGVDKDFGHKYRMPDIGNMKGPKFGDIHWRDDISEQELKDLFKSMGKEFTTMESTETTIKDGAQHTTTTTTTQSADGTTTKTTTSYWKRVTNNKLPLHERMKEAERRAKEKMKEMEMNSPKKPSFFNFGTSHNQTEQKQNIDTLLRQMQGSNTNDWHGPTVKGFDHENLKQFTEDMLLFQQQEFERRLKMEPVPSGIIAKGKHILLQNAKRALFMFTHKIRGILARGILRNLKKDEEKRKQS